MTYINNLGDVGQGDVAVAGGKGVGLGGLIRAGLPVPPGFVLNTAAYADFVEANHLEAGIQELAALPPEAPPEDYEDASKRIRALFAGGTMPAVIAAELGAAYGRLGDGDTAVAVRSSATAEDLASASFAGQQETYLNVLGTEALAAAVTDCWASLWTARAMAYRAREGIAPDTVRLAVVVQRMVEAEAAGVMFTANPANGRRDQIVISAAWGLGESVVSGTVTTDDVVVEAGTGRVLSRRTADKEVMTVYADHGTREQPVPAARRHQPVLDDRAAAALAGYGTRIADHFGAPQDIEWARAGGEFFILQSRPITALPEPAADTPDTWTVPYPNGLYFRASIVEQLPDPLSPLFADLIDGSVARSLRALMAEAVGKNVIREGDVGLPTINGYAYYYYRTSGMWRMMGKSLTAVRALLRGKAHMGVAGWREYSHPRYERVIEDWSAKPVAELSGEELLEGVQALLDAATVYYTAVQSIIPIAATSEISFRAYYDKVRSARRRSPRPDVPPRLRQRTHPGGEVAVRASSVGPRECRGWPRHSLMNRRRHWSESQARRVPACRLRPGTVAAVASTLPGPSRPVRPCCLQSGFRQPGAGRRSLGAAGDGEVLPSGTGQRPARAPAAVGRPQGGPNQPNDHPARAAPPGGVHPAAPVGTERRPDPRGCARRRRPGVAAAAADAARTRTAAG